MSTPPLVENHLEDSNKTVWRDPFWVYSDISPHPGFDSVTLSEIVTACSVQSLTNSMAGRLGRVIIDFFLNERVSLGSVSVVLWLLE